MEGLNLEDLQIDVSPDSLFEDDEDNQLANEIDNPEGSDQDNNISDGEGANPSQDGVASSQENTSSEGASKNGEGSNSSSPNNLNEDEQLYSSLAAEFKANGALSGLEDTSNIKSIEDINKAIEEEVERRLGDTNKKVLEAKGAGAELDEVTEVSNSIEGLKSYTEDNIIQNRNLRLNVIAHDFMSKGVEEDKAKELATRSVESGKDIEDAKYALNSLIKSQEKKLEDLVQDAKDKELKNLNDIKEFVHSDKEIIPGIKLSKNQQEELYSQMTTDTGSRENAFMKAQKEDPMGSRIRLETLFYLTDGLKDFSVFGKKAETKITNKIDNLLKGSKFAQSGKSGASVQDFDANFKLTDLGDFDIDL